MFKKLLVALLMMVAAVAQGTLVPIDAGTFSVSAAQPDVVVHLTGSEFTWDEFTLKLSSSGMGVTVECDNSGLPSGVSLMLDPSSMAAVPLNLSVGALIGETGFFDDGSLGMPQLSGGGTSPFSSGGYMGFSMSSRFGTHYGWMHVAPFDPTSPTAEFTVDGGFYEDESGVSVSVVPEPTTLGLLGLALGASVFMCRRR